MKKIILAFILLIFVSACAMGMSGGAENADESDYYSASDDIYGRIATEEIDAEDGTITYELSPEEDIYMLDNNEEANEQDDRVQGTEETETED